VRTINIEFRRVLTGAKWDAWILLVQRLMTSSINLTSEEDRFIWKLTQSGSFTVSSMYADLLNDHTVFLRKKY
jgi:hypothetical protein